MSAPNSVHDTLSRDYQPTTTSNAKAATATAAETDDRNSQHTKVDPDISSLPNLTSKPTYIADEKIVEAGWGPGHAKKPSSDALDHYFVGPRDLEKHSKLPQFMRLHGSVMPKMIVPLLFVGAWATVITVISRYVYNRKFMLTMIKKGE